MDSRYHLIFADTDLAGLITAAGLAASGMKVLVVEREGSLKSEIPTSVLGDILASPIQKLLSYLPGVNWQDYLVPQSAVAHVLLPKHRFCIQQKSQETLLEIDREFSGGCNTLAEELKKITKVFSSIPPSELDQVSSLTQSSLWGFSQKKRIKQALGSYSAPVFFSQDFPSSELWRNKTTPSASLDLQRITRVLAGVLGHSSPENLSAEAVVRLFGLLFSGRFLIQNESQLRSLCKSIIEKNSGCVFSHAVVQDLIFEKDKFSGVLLSSYHGIIEANAVVLGKNIQALYNSIPDRLQQRTLLQKLKTIQVKSWRFHLDLEIPKKYIPEMLESFAVVLKRPELGFQEENLITIERGALKGEVTSLRVSCLVPKLSSTWNASYLQILSGKILQTLETAIPFLREALNQGKVYPNPQNLEEFQYFLKSVQPDEYAEKHGQIYVRSGKNLQSFWGLPWNIGIPGIFFSGRMIWPALGVHGEFLSLLKIREFLNREGLYYDRSIHHANHESSVERQATL